MTVVMTIHLILDNPSTERLNMMMTLDEEPALLTPTMTRSVEKEKERKEVVEKEKEREMIEVDDHPHLPAKEKAKAKTDPPQSLLGNSAWQMELESVSSTFRIPVVKETNASTSIHLLVCIGRLEIVQLERSVSMLIMTMLKYTKVSQVAGLQVPRVLPAQTNVL